MLNANVNMKTTNVNNMLALEEQSDQHQTQDSSQDYDCLCNNPRNSDFLAVEMSLSTK